VVGALDDDVVVVAEEGLAVFRAELRPASPAHPPHNRPSPKTATKATLTALGVRTTANCHTELGVMQRKHPSFSQD